MAIGSAGYRRRHFRSQRAKWSSRNSPKSHPMKVTIGEAPDWGSPSPKNSWISCMERSVSRVNPVLEVAFGSNLDSPIALSEKPQSEISPQPPLPALILFAPRSMSGKCTPNPLQRFTASLRVCVEETVLIDELNRTGGKHACIFSAMDRRSGYLGASRLEYLDSAYRKKTIPKKFPIVVLLARNARFDSERAPGGGSNSCDVQTTPPRNHASGRFPTRCLP